jgi:murein DD-endopeptidase MepM/ murein hydrolase activator NlpD
MLDFHMRSLKPVLVALLLAASVLPAAALPSVSCPSGLRPGEPLLIWIRDGGTILDGKAELRGPAGNLVDSGLLFEKAGGWPAEAAQAPAARGHLYGVLLAIPMDAKPGRYGIVLTGSEVPAGQAAKAPPAEGSVPTTLQAAAVNGSPAQPPAGAVPFRLDLALGIEARKFFSEDISLDQGNTGILTAPDPRKEAEAIALHSLLAQVDEGAVYLDGGFVLPVDATRRTANFGDRRRYLYAQGGSETSVHAGIDVAVPQGSPVRSCAAGRVVFVGMRIVTGYTVVVEHLPGLYSIYMHLSTPKVVQGQLLARGELLGLSGSTGLSTGPHLHWELRLRDRAVDPDFWVSSPPLDKDWPISTMSSAYEGG